MKNIKDATPVFWGYKDYPKDEEGKIILPRNENGVIKLFRENLLDYGNGLIGLLDGSKISESTWQDLRKCFIITENDGTEKFYWSIGGSDSGVCMGLSPYNNLKGLYKSKKTFEKETIEDAQSFVFEYGHRNEELIAMGFQSLTNMEVIKDNTVFFNEKIGFMQANVDYFVRHPDGEFSILEIKTVNSENSSAINDYKKSKVPLYYYSQAVLHYPKVLGDVYRIKGTYFAVGYSNSLKSIIICHFNRDYEQEELLVTSEKEFHDYLKYNIEPTDEATALNAEGVIEHLRQQFPKAEEKSITLSGKALEAMANYNECGQQISYLNKELKSLEATQNIYKAIVMEEMGTAEFTEDFDIGEQKYYLTFKNSQRETVDKTILKTKYPEIYKEVVNVTDSRTFRLNKAKKKK